MFFARLQQEQRFLLLVVVGVAVVAAQAHNAAAARALSVTSLRQLGAATRVAAGGDDGDGKDSLDAAAAEPASAVVDLRSLCAQLCGAGLGGAPCAGHCAADAASNNNNNNNSSTAASEAILPANDAAAGERICRDLCALGLGGGEATCGCQTRNAAPPALRLMAAASGGDLSPVCWTFCANGGGRQLNGCRPCAAQATQADATTTAAGGGALRQPRSDDGGGSTTPDWNEVCESLCKTGDGGSLCNCDLSPFKRRRRLTTADDQQSGSGGDLVAAL